MTLKISLRKKDLYLQVLEEKTSFLKKKLDLHDRDYFEINLILDEMCTNIFENNGTTANLEINIEIRWEKKNLNIVFQDNGIPFDPSSVSAPDINLPLSERQAGGFGLFFVNKYSNHLHYQRVDDNNQTILRKKLR